jgi:hypothetical protein
MSNPPSAPTSDDPPLPVEVEVIFQVAPDGREGFLVLAPIGGGDVLEVPLSRADVAQLICAMSEFVWPGCRLQATPPAGRA